ncbi:MAG: AraC family transcriptional regulator ligand-binding domain-containing protein [Bacteroidota bacterium]
MSFNARFVADLIQFGELKGVLTRPIYERIGYTPEELQSPDLKLSREVYNQVCRALITQTQDPAFGLHVGSYWTLPAAGLVAQIIQTSRTIGEGIQYLCTFSNLGCSSLPFSLEKTKGEAYLRVQHNEAWYRQAPEVFRHTLEGLLLFNLQGLRTLTHGCILPIRLSLPYARTDVPRTVYEGYFQCPVAFSQAGIALQLPLEVIDLPIKTADYDLLQVLVRHAKEKSSRLAGGDYFPDRVQQVIYQLMGHGFPAQEAVAETLHMSARTLQRRLREAGTNYKKIVERLKEELAKDYLCNPDLSIQMISDLLNYAEPSVFSRSFKRWTNQSPKAFRQALAQ